MSVVAQVCGYPGTKTHNGLGSTATSSASIVAYRETMAAVVQVHVTETKTETYYTESRDHARIHQEYFRTPEAIARIAAILILFITLITCAIAGGATGSWGSSLAGFDILYLLIMFVIRLLGYGLLFNGLLVRTYCCIVFKFKHKLLVSELCNFISERDDLVCNFYCPGC
jgi:hypothetical protein